MDPSDYWGGLLAFVRTANAVTGLILSDPETRRALQLDALERRDRLAAVVTPTTA